MNSTDFRAICIAVFLGICMWDIFKHIIFPWIVNKRTKDIEQNPNWIMNTAKNYYGFHDIDFIIVDSPLGCTPRFRTSKDKKRLQLLLDTDTTTAEVDKILRAALASKIKVNYGLWYPDKPLHWLSILCYMLDGGDVKEAATSWEIVKK